jgi:hypothetical protein
MFKNSVAVTIGGAILACFLQQAWWLRGLEGAALGFASFVTIPAVYTWAKRKMEAVHITVGCSPAAMPTKLPPEGFTTVMLFPGAGGSMVGYGEGGEPTGWPKDTPAYRCEVRNLSGKVLPAISITLPVEYRNADGSAIEEAKRHKKITIIAPRLDAQSERPFVFYVRCPSVYGAKISEIFVDYYDKDPALPPIDVKSNLLFPIEFGMAQ